MKHNVRVSAGIYSEWLILNGWARDKDGGALGQAEAPRHIPKPRKVSEDSEYQRTRGRIPAALEVR